MMHIANSAQNSRPSMQWYYQSYTMVSYSKFWTSRAARLVMLAPSPIVLSSIHSLGNPAISEAGSTQIFCKSPSAHVKILKSRCFPLVRIRRPSQVQVFQLPVARRCTQCGEQWHSVSEVLIKFHVSCVAFQKLAQLIKTIIRDWGSVIWWHLVIWPLNQQKLSSSDMDARWVMSNSRQNDTKDKRNTL